MSLGEEQRSSSMLACINETGLRRGHASVSRILLMILHSTVVKIHVRALLPVYYSMQDIDQLRIACQIEAGTGFINYIRFYLEGAFILSDTFIDMFLRPGQSVPGAIRGLKQGDRASCSSHTCHFNLGPKSYLKCPGFTLFHIDIQNAFYVPF